MADLQEAANQFIEDLSQSPRAPQASEHTDEVLAEQCAVSSARVCHPPPAACESRNGTRVRLGP